MKRDRNIIKTLRNVVHHSILERIELVLFKEITVANRLRWRTQSLLNELIWK